MHLDVKKLKYNYYWVLCDCDFDLNQTEVSAAGLRCNPQVREITYMKSICYKIDGIQFNDEDLVELFWYDASNILHLNLAPFKNCQKLWSLFLETEYIFLCVLIVLVSLKTFWPRKFFFWYNIQFRRLIWARLCFYSTREGKSFFNLQGTRGARKLLKKKRKGINISSRFW